MNLKFKYKPQVILSQS